MKISQVGTMEMNENEALMTRRKLRKVLKGRMSVVPRKSQAR
jgi:hypothetical protein